MLLLPAGYFSYEIFMAACGGNRAIAASAVAAYVLHPSILAVFATVQNDAFCYLWTLAAIWYLAKTEREIFQRRFHCLALGALNGLAILSKMNALPLVIAIPLFLWSKRKESSMAMVIRGVVDYSLAFAMVAGWWVIRNKVLYGDFTGHMAIYYFAKEPDVLPLWKLTGVYYFMQNFLAYYTMPSEYYRNVFQVPFLVRGMAVASVVLFFAGCVRFSKPLIARLRRYPMARFLFGFVLITFGIHILASVGEAYFGPRITFVAFPAVVLAFCVVFRFIALRLMGRNFESLLLYATVAMMLGLDAYLLVTANSFPEILPTRTFFEAAVR